MRYYYIGRLLPLYFFIGISLISNSQNFNYSVTSQQTPFVFINPLVKNTGDSVANKGVEVSNNSIWDDNTYPISIGFPFSFAGQVFDSVKIRTNGTFTFDKENKYNFVILFKNFICETNEQNNSISPITVENTVLSNGQKRMCIEFQNALFFNTDGIKKHVNFQVYLNQEDNSIEFHMGETDASDTCIIGMLNMNNNNNGSAFGYLLQGSPLSPEEIMVNVGTIVQLTSMPPAGTVYKFNKN